MLYKKPVCDESRLQLVLPRSCVPRAMRGVHDEVGHPGRERTLSLLRERFYWPGMTPDVSSLRRKCHLPPKAPMVSIGTSQPLELVCTDILTLE